MRICVYLLRRQLKTCMIISDGCHLNTKGGFLDVFFLRITQLGACQLYIWKQVHLGQIKGIPSLRKQEVFPPFVDMSAIFFVIG